VRRSLLKTLKKKAKSLLSIRKRKKYLEGLQRQKLFIIR
jgi:hypothetical protein